MAKKKSDKKTLLLLDGNAIIHRAYHALPPLTAPDGTQTNAAYGFTSTLLSVLTQFQPDYIIATFDAPGKTFRHDAYSEYKATRKETPEDLGPQFALTHDVVRQMQIPCIIEKGVEADDVIGTLSVLATAEDVETIIVTGDKDTFQLVDDHVSVFTMSRGFADMILYDPEKVVEKMGVTPEQVIDYKGIRGDSSDNIPGIRGIGEKGAVDLLTRFQNLEGVYEHIDEVTGANHKKLVEQKEMAFLSRELGTIRTDVDVILDLPAAESTSISWDGARKAFQKYGFKSLLRRLPDNVGRVENGELSQEKKRKAKERKGKSRNVIVESRKDAEKFLASHAKDQIVVVPDSDGAGIYGAALESGGEGVYIVYSEKTKDLLGEFFADEKIEKAVFNLKAWKHMLQVYGLSLSASHDVQLMAYVGRAGKMDFENLVFEVLGEEVPVMESGSQLTLGLRDTEGAQQYALRTAELTQGLRIFFHEKIAETVKTQSSGRNATTVLENIEMPLVEILFAMECAGIGFDKEIFARIATKTNKLVSALEKKIYDLAGSEFNINSTKQLRVVLFEDLEIPTANITKTKTGYSTASNELEKMRALHPIIGEIEQYRELFKLKTTYIDALPLLVAADGRIHTTYNQAVASTGRLSSSHPNLQNIPIRSEAGRALREGFVAGKKKKFISADYSQIELRCVAHVANDAAMIDAFQKSQDIHTFTAATVLGKKLEDITKDERSSAKELNFGLIYGMGAFSFARSAGISTDEAKDFIAKYFEQFSGVKTYMDDTRKAAEEVGYVETLLGRRHYTPGAAAKNPQLRAAAERAAINMPIQGLAADIMKLAMIAVSEMLTKKYVGKATMLLQVHDEIIVEADAASADAVAHDVEKVMEGVYPLSVPLVVDVALGSHWGEL